MEVNIAVSKVNKYATSESGDTLEVVERPGGGISIVLADGQRSGKSAKRISNLVVRKVISLLAEGVRDGAAARAASDALYHEKGGVVQASLNILSVDLSTHTLVITRNNPAPVYFINGEGLGVIDEETKPVGLYKNTRPSIKELHLELGMAVLAFTDGLVHAGDRQSRRMDIPGLFARYNSLPEASADRIADALLDDALALDENRPIDDISLVVLRVAEGTEDSARRLHMRLPLK
ncbi:MAG: SpoIIE family protein phosphatase [Anaerolineales bacterium]|nr:SpoIIE family protein phosphatase [Anaerolineales bacterium]